MASRSKYRSPHMNCATQPRKGETPMEHKQVEMAEMGLTRTGRASGCSCCSFTMLGLIALPILAVVAFFLAV